MSSISCTSQTKNPTKIDNSLVKNETGLYVCPPCNSSCDKLEFDDAGNCNQCGMELVLKDSLKEHVVPSRKKIAFYLQPGVEILDFAGPMEVFSSAGFEVFTVSKTTEAITTQGILKFIPDYSIQNAPQSDILAFFGGGNASGVSKDPEIINWIQSRQDVEYYFSVCTGAFILAEAGLLNGKTATTFHGAINQLKKNYPKINVLENTRYVDNGKIITTAGVSAGIDGALHLVAKLQGPEKAKEVVTYMEYDKWVPNEGLILDNSIPSSTTNNKSN